VAPPSYPSEEEIAPAAQADRNMFCQACRHLAYFIQISNRNIECDVR
jgi:hypothetical protein